MVGERDAGDIKIVPSAARLVKFCLGFLLRIHQVMNFKCWEGERINQECGSLPSLSPLTCAIRHKQQNFRIFFLYGSDTFKRVEGIALGEGCLCFESNIGVIT